jgi:hypothetical protein
LMHCHPFHGGFSIYCYTLTTNCPSRIAAAFLNWNCCLFHMLNSSWNFKQSYLFKLLHDPMCFVNC